MYVLTNTITITQSRQEQIRTKGHVTLLQLSESAINPRSPQDIKWANQILFPMENLTQFEKHIYVDLIFSI